MPGYIHRRLLAAVPVVLGVSILTFSVLHLLPGDPVMILLGKSAEPPERVSELRAQLGLDDPIAIQYARYLGNALRGDLGRSIRSNRPVLDEIRQQAPRTLELTLAGLGVAAVLGISLGVLAARHRNSWLDRVSVAVSLVGCRCRPFGWACS